jgi:hypothetical protein
MKSLIYCCAAAVLLSFCACEKDDENNPDPGGDDPQKGFVTGKVTDSEGRGMEGIQVYFDNTVYYNSGFSTTTGPGGAYSSEIPYAGAYRAYAEMRHTYNDRVFEIEFHPENFDSFNDGGAVRNFQWKLTGEKPSNPGTYYGGEIWINPDPESNIYDRENVQLTLTPVGPLIDGSAGQTLQRSCGAPLTDWYAKIKDVPIGRYEITAVHLPTGTPLKLREFYPEPYQDAITLDFYGEDSPLACNNCLQVEFTD